LNLFVFGLGYSVLHVLRSRPGRFARVAGTVRTADKAAMLAADGILARPFGGEDRDPRIADDLEAAEAILVSIPPEAGGDPALTAFRPALEGSPRLRTVVYLSTLAVYGDQGGRWIDEATPATPSSERGRRRLEAEEGWAEVARTAGARFVTLRLAGIYGPGRNMLRDVAAGTARRIVKPGQVFNRIHVEDIAAAMLAALENGEAEGPVNVSDDEPAPPQDVVAFAAGLLGRPPPPELAFEEAALSPAAAAFYGECKRASNARLKSLGVTLRYPSYREGLRALLHDDPPEA
jgi:nucleoside-diphosphate-sugar epimerase